MKKSGENKHQKIGIMSSAKDIWAIIPRLGTTGAGMKTPCIKCRSCEAACSFYKEGKLNPKMSRIRVYSKELEWIEGTADTIVEPTVCKQCPGTPPCALICPVNAIDRDLKTGAVVIDDEKCTRCRLCINACPYDAIWFNKSEKRILKCDLCGGEPKCVEWCPVGVLKYIKIKKEG